MATNHAYASYSEVYDLHTEVGTATVLGIHTPQNTNPQAMLWGFWTQFRKYRYIGADVTLIPVSTLPADPLQVSYEAGETTIDPRDMVNPILYKGAHGQSLGAVIDTLLPDGVTGSTMGSSLDRADVDNIPVGDDDLPVFDAGVLETLYYEGLSSPAWGKAHVQRGFSKKNLYPLVYALGTDTPIGNGFGVEYDNQPPNLNGNLTGSTMVGGTPPSRIGNNMDYGTTGVGREFTYRCARLGWLDTFVPTYTQDQTVPDGNWSRCNGIPKLMMMVILLPPAYKTEFYFRMVIRHKFEFRNFACSRGPDAFTQKALVGDDISTEIPAYKDWADPSISNLSVSSAIDMSSGQVKLASAGVS